MNEACSSDSQCAEHDRWGDLLDAYATDRRTVGSSLISLGRRIGRDQVEFTPPWSEMSAEDFERWTAGTLSGDKLYFWSADEPAEAT